MGLRLVSLTDEDIELINKAFDGCPALYSESQRVLSKLAKSQKRITVHSAKAKGREFQMEICRKISSLLGIPYDQQDDNSLIQSRPMAQQGVDIILRGRARELFPFNVECKATTVLDLPDAVKQAEANTEHGRIGAVAFKQTNFDPVVIFSWNSFEELYHRFVKQGELRNT